MPSIGEILREARKKKGFSEEAAAKAIKIKLDRLRGLEADNYEEFPAQVYARSFLRQYAEYLGLDSAVILQAYADLNPAPPQKAVFEITEDQRSSPVKRHVPAQAPNLSLTSTGRTVLVCVVGVVILIGCCIYGLYKSQLSTTKIRSSDASMNSETATPSAKADAWQTSTPEAKVAQPVLSFSNNESNVEMLLRKP